MDQLNNEQRLIVEDNIKLAHYIAHKWNEKLNFMVNYDDLYDSCIVALIKSVICFKPEREVKLSSFAVKCMDNEVKMLLRHSNKSIKSIPLSDFIIVDSDGFYDSWEMIQTNYIINDNIQDWIEETSIYQAITTLKPKQKEMLLVKMQVHSQEEAVKILGFSQSYISRVLKKARLQVRKELNK